VPSKQKYLSLTPLHKQYPQRLRLIPNKPRRIWAKGKNLDLFNRPSLAVIGSRKYTNYGQKATKKLVSGLVNAGLVIVSGMARGIDSLAHQTALDNNGQTIAVLGSGLGYIYPPENHKLYHKIDLVVSEYSPNTSPKKHHFLERNRIISGLADGLLVIEASRRSGTLNTAKHAAEQNKEVFVIPGPITSPNSKGTTWLANQGAKVISGIKDILVEI
jgi:DNA processing protein